VARMHYWNYSIGTGALYAKHLFARGGLLKHLYWDLPKALNEAGGYDKLERGFESGYSVDLYDVTDFQKDGTVLDRFGSGS
jgi:hypothetical protein